MQKSFKRTFASLEQIFGFTESFFATEEIDPDHRFAVNFAVEEIFTNMVKYHAQSDSEIIISLDREDDCLRVVLTDFDVEPFDVTRSEDVDIHAPLEERSIGGLGLHLTKKMMDAVDYEYVDRESRVKLIKFLG